METLPVIVHIKYIYIILERERHFIFPAINFIYSWFSHKITMKSP